MGAGACKTKSASHCYVENLFLPLMSWSLWPAPCTDNCIVIRFQSFDATALLGWQTGPTLPPASLSRGPGTILTLKVGSLWGAAVTRPRWLLRMRGCGWDAGLCARKLPGPPACYTRFLPRTPQDGAALGAHPHYLRFAAELRTAVLPGR